MKKQIKSLADLNAADHLGLTESALTKIKGGNGNTDGRKYVPRPVILDLEEGEV